ncbi:synaptotagmin-4 isoform X2 [Daphnia magna]|uniref:EOG090X05OW n=1 Tax=Daphnia magna TaxID=35525 RepID=A0A4Y7MTL7_9CRUS|nr:synaptotagmin-4 isoform X2 [Daphnia magna]CAG4639160.1 EOG090X05OW [Daphnia magna]SVE83055.1 EOG090X05OW [Daphnia magna]
MVITVLVDITKFAVSTPAVVGICLGGVVLLISVAAVSCFCYRGHQQQTRKKMRSPGSHLGSESRPLAFRKPVAVKSPNSQQQLTHSHSISGGSSAAISHHMKKSPSPTGAKTPPGSCPIGKSPSPLSGTTPSTLTPTYEMNSPQVSRKNSLVGTTCRSGNNAIQEESVQQQRETVIRFQLENEVTHPAKAELIKSDLVPSASAHQDNVPGEIDVNMDGSYSEGGTNKLGQLYFKVRYGAHIVEKSTLNITVVRCQGLPARDSNVGSSDPYVKLQLLPDKHHKVKTRVLRRTLNPVYDEDFTFYGIGKNQLQSLTLHFVVLSFDRYSRDDVIGEVLLPVNEALEEMTDTVDCNNADNGNHSGALLSREIAPRSHKMRTHGRGELLVSLCYQPQASRLTAVVLKARNIPRMDMTGLADPYVKIYLVHNGQRVAKKKTHVKKRTLNPVFNESFVFDLPAGATSLDSISLEFLVLDWDRVTKNEEIGRLELGGTKSSGTALHHWNEVINSPRRQIAEWHKLKD